MPIICIRSGLGMKGFRNWRVGVKLVAGFLAVAAIAAVIGGLGLRSTSQVNQMAMLMYGQEVAGIRHASQCAASSGGGRSCGSCRVAGTR
ncbi:MCP four helix bundle domain-containing protein [Neopusillimonas aromaticivorans]|uniref:MCP four helix bundle domain-containing protein n=1 Tax=Neopusillimonas aromaticivorans TaxID=2979868 RepID=UPI0033158425